MSGISVVFKRVGTLFGVDKWRDYRLSVLLLFCLVLGGTSQDSMLIKLPVYLLSIVVICTVFSSKQLSFDWGRLLAPVALFAAFLFLFVVYLIPMPPSIWGNLPGREIVVDGFDAVGAGLPWMPLSLTPQKSFYSLFDFLPVASAGALIAFSASKAEVSKAVSVLPIFAVVSVVLGVVQVVANSAVFYIYETTNYGAPVGFFSNVNHQACLLAMIAPVSLAWLMGWGASNRLRAFGAISYIAIVLGVLLAGSISGLFLLGVSSTLTALLFARNRVHYFAISLLVMLGCSIAVIDTFLLGGNSVELAAKLNSENELNRLAVYESVLEIIPKFGIWGSGPGSFYEVYLLAEDQTSISTKYVPQAHNDYLSIALEFGVFGLSIVITFLCWFCLTAIQLMRKRGRTYHLNKIAVIAVSIPLLHSVLDYPLRTIAVMTVFSSLCLISVKAGRGVY